MGVIYKITNPNGRQYVGKTYCLRKRINAHKHNAKKDSNIILANSIKKYGWDAHKLEIIEEVEDALLDEREMFWVKELKTYCYNYAGQMNMTLGGEGQRSTWKHDLKRVKEYSERFGGNKNPFFGKNHSEESKKMVGEKASKRNKERGITIPKWGNEKRRLQVIKSVIVYNTNGYFLFEKNSLVECANFLNVSIGSINDSLKYNCWVEGKYQVRYKKDNYPLSINVSKVTFKTIARPIFCFVGNHIIEYPKAEMAAKDLSIPVTTIRRAAQYNKGKPIRTGYVFMYKDLYEKLKMVS